MKGNRMFLIALVLLLTTPLFIGYVSYQDKAPTVWIVGPDQFDESTLLAMNTIIQEIPDASSIIHTTTLEHLDTIPLQTNVLIIVGHGNPDGIESTEGIIAWEALYSSISELQAQKTVVLACNSPTDIEANVFGFPGLIDAEAGALLTVWQAMMEISSDRSPNISIDRILHSQSEMKNPLATAVFFVHGYFGSNSGWYDLVNDLDLGFYGIYDIVEYFDYFAKYPEMTQNEVHFLQNPISTYANDLADAVIARVPDNTQVDFVAHSLGGIIVREMIRLRSDDLKANKIGIDSVFTLATPHLGTKMADENLVGDAYAFIRALYGEQWYSPALQSLYPTSYFMQQLNGDPVSYDSGINWHALATHDYWPSLLTFYIHWWDSDGLVSVLSALTYEPGWNIGPVDSCSHGGIIDSSNTFSYLDENLPGSVDTDNDCLHDAVETWVYNTDPYNPDSDNDGIEDGQEVYIYHTDPANPNSDGDALSDGVEVAWGYDPANVNSPIPAASLIYSAAAPKAGLAYVIVNDYEPIGHIKVYVRYYWGTWGSFSLVATLYEPNYGTKYKVLWTNVPSYATMMEIKVEAYHASLGYLGRDLITKTVNGGGGGPTPD